MTDGRPLSSEEMIEQARRGLSRPPSTPSFDVDRIVIDEESAFEEEPATATKRPTRPTRRTQAPRSTSPQGDPFTPPRRRDDRAQRAASLVVALVLGVIGIALALALAATNAP